MPRIRDDEEASLTWRLRLVLRRGHVYYAKLARGRATSWPAADPVSLFHAILGRPANSEEQHRLSRSAQAILRVLRREWAMSTSDLRTESGVTDRPAFGRALDELQAAMVVVPSDVFYHPKFTYVWTLAVGRFPDALRRRVKRDTALREVGGFSCPRRHDRSRRAGARPGLSRSDAGRGTGRWCGRLRHDALDREYCLCSGKSRTAILSAGSRRVKSKLQIPIQPPPTAKFQQSQTNATNQWRAASSFGFGVGRGWIWSWSWD